MHSGLQRSDFGLQILERTYESSKLGHDLFASVGIDCGFETVEVKIFSEGTLAHTALLHVSNHLVCVLHQIKVDVASSLLYPLCARETPRVAELRTLGYERHATSQCAAERNTGNDEPPVGGSHVFYDVKKTRRDRLQGTLEVDGTNSRAARRPPGRPMPPSGAGGEQSYPPATSMPPTCWPLWPGPWPAA